MLLTAGKPMRPGDDHYTHGVGASIPSCWMSENGLKGGDNERTYAGGCIKGVEY